MLCEAIEFAIESLGFGRKTKVKLLSASSNDEDGSLFSYFNEDASFLILHGFTSGFLSIKPISSKLLLGYGV